MTPLTPPWLKKYTGVLVAEDAVAFFSAAFHCPLWKVDMTALSGALPKTANMAITRERPKRYRSWAITSGFEWCTIAHERRAALLLGAMVVISVIPYRADVGGFGWDLDDFH